jgi:hypothetical protein
MHEDNLDHTRVKMRVHYTNFTYPIHDEVKRSCFDDIKKVAWSALKYQICPCFHLQTVEKSLNNAPVVAHIPGKHQYYLLSFECKYH